MYDKSKWTTDKFLLLKQLLVMHRQYKFPSIHHMLNSAFNLNMRSTSITKANFSHYTHDCAKSFNKMGFQLNIDEQCWEQVADIHIWHNSLILDSNNNEKPFDQYKQPWSKIFGHKLQFLYQLTDFDFGKYKGSSGRNADPEVKQLRWLTKTELNTKFSTSNRVINFSKEVWDNLINSIPLKWANTLLSGNQTFKDNEFFATALENQIGDVYKYNGGLLFYYQWDDTNDNPDDDARSVHTDEYLCMTNYYICV